MIPRDREVTLTGRIELDVYRATKFERLELAARLIRRYVQAHGSAAAFFEPDETGESAFDLWARTRDPELLRIIKGYDIPWTPHFAAKWGELDVLKELVAAAADALESRDASGGTAMHSALAHGQLEVARWLIKQGIDLTDADEGYVRAAARSRSEEAVRFAVQHGAPVDGGEDAPSALHEECAQGYSKLLACLLELGADPNAPDPTRDGNTALHLAVERTGSLRIAKLLVDGGADPEAGNNRGETPLDIALRRDVPELVEFLSGGMRGSSVASY